MKKRLVAIILTLCLIMGVAPIASAVDINDSSVFLKQSKNDTCTYTAAAMMLRRRAIIDGGNWSAITEDSVRNATRVPNVGMLNSYTYSGMSVKYQFLSNTYTTTEAKKSFLISLLKDHPEGVVAYNQNRASCGQWHAILMTDYDASNDTFYCADPAGSSRGRIKFANSTIKGSGQDGKLYYINGIWYITNRSGGGTPTPPPNGGENLGMICDKENETISPNTKVSFSYWMTGATAFDIIIKRDGVECDRFLNVSNPFEYYPKIEGDYTAYGYARNDIGSTLANSRKFHVKNSDPPPSGGENLGMICDKENETISPNTKVSFSYWMTGATAFDIIIKRDGVECDRFLNVSNPFEYYPKVGGDYTAYGYARNDVGSTLANSRKFHVKNPNEDTPAPTPTITPTPTAAPTTAPTAEPTTAPTATPTTAPTTSPTTSLLRPLPQHLILQM